MLHQHLHTVSLEGTPPGAGERLSASAQSAAIYAFIHGCVSLLVIALGIWLNDLQTGKQALPANLVAYLGVITFVVNYLIVWAKHWIETGDWEDPDLPVAEPRTVPPSMPAPPLETGRGAASVLSTDPVSLVWNSLTTSGTVGAPAHTIAPVLPLPGEGD